MSYKRVLLKLSGEALKGKLEFGIDPDIVLSIAKQIKDVTDSGIEVAVVVGGGNIWRGKTAEGLGMERSNADYMGMLATVMNGISVQEGLERVGVNAIVMSGLPVEKCTEPFNRRNALNYLDKKTVVVFAGGTGNPYFSTDTGASLRAAEVRADVILMAKNGTKGVYDKDPNKHNDAKMYDKLTHSKIIKDELQVMDLTGAALCKDNDINIVVFDMNEVGNIKKAASGVKIGTTITN